jgi:PmbA protein
VRDEAEHKADSEAVEVGARRCRDAAGVSDALEIAERALAQVSGDEGEVYVGTEHSGFARYAGSAVHQPTLIDDTTVELRVISGRRAAVATTNRTDDEGLAELARRAAELVASAGEDPDVVPAAPPAEHPKVGGYDEATASLGPDGQARLAAEAIAAVDGLELYGYVTSAVCESAMVSTAGLRATQQTTDATCLALAATEGASGYAMRTSWRAGELDPAAVAREAAEKAERTRGAVEIEPGRYRAVLEPYALSELLYYFAFDALNGLALLEERSYFAGRVDERAFDSKLTLVDDPLSDDSLPRSFDFEGTAKQRVVLVEDGVIRGPVWDRATAARAGRHSTGHALPTASRSFGPVPTNLELTPGDAESVDELAEVVGDGIYVTRLHYLSVVNSREAVLTGMTRDGTFRIRDGKVAEPLANLRFTVAVPDVLANVLGLTRDATLVNQSDFYDERWAYGNRVPALATAAFNVTGVGGGPGL